MRIFEGTGGEVYLASDPFRFTGQPLTDCGNGFDWRPADAALGCWVEPDELRFELLDGEQWVRLDPDTVEAPVGRVSFRRNLRGRRVRASGVCLPLALLATGGRWRLTIGFRTVREDTLGDSKYVSLPTGTVAAIDECVEASAYETVPRGAQVAVKLRQTGSGFFAGAGEVAGYETNTLHVNFNEEGVCYVCN